MDKNESYRAWEKCEEIAMHFNTLISGLRLKALGAIAVGTGLLGTVVATKSERRDPMNFYLLAAAMAFLFAIWLSIWVIDHFYYRRMLAGAVREIARIELTPDFPTQLSRTIEAEVHRRPLSEQGTPKSKPGGEICYRRILPWLYTSISSPIHWFYGLPAVAMLATCCFAFNLAARMDPGTAAADTAQATDSTLVVPTSTTVNSGQP